MVMQDIVTLYYAIGLSKIWLMDRELGIGCWYFETTIIIRSMHELYAPVTTDHRPQSAFPLCAILSAGSVYMS